MNKRTWTIVGMALFSAMLLIIVFLHIDYCGIYRWDESRNAMNALEMSEGGNPLVRTIFSQPDHWETKPPLLIWLQVIFIKILGPSELALRLPSAMAGLALAGSILLFFKKQLHDIRAGVLSVLILFTADGYVRPHVLRSGDHDALLILWLIIALFTYFQFLERSEKGLHGRSGNGKYLLWAGLSITAAVLTKSITGLFFLPGMLIFTVLSQKLPALIRSKWLYISAGLFVAIVGAYYLGRTYFDPDYLYWVNENELFKRYFNTSVIYGYEQRSIWFYTRLLRDSHFNNWIWLLPLIVVPFAMPRNQTTRRFTTYVFINSAVFLFIISKGTGNDWYDAPIIPMLSILLGISFARILELIATKFHFLNGRHGQVAFIAICILIFSYPFYETMDRQVYQPQPSFSDMAYGNMIRAISKEHEEMKEYAIISEYDNNITNFYVKVYNNYKGYKLTDQFTCSEDQPSEIRALQPGGRFVVCSDYYKSIINDLWDYETLLSNGDCLLIEIASLK
ncbi:MAG: hypothetical protein GY751_11980 [Bacteroidetes bacterium]|nr:hypothetical protein [Bacteroidota bacterium]